MVRYSRCSLLCYCLPSHKSLLTVHPLELVRHGKSPRLNASIIPSAVLVAKAEMVNAGLAAPPVTKTLPSPMNRLGTSCVRHHGSTTDVPGSLPIRQVPR